MVCPEEQAKKFIEYAKEVKTIIQNMRSEEENYEDREKDYSGCRNFEHCRH